MKALVMITLLLTGASVFCFARFLWQTGTYHNTARYKELKDRYLRAYGRADWNPESENPGVIFLGGGIACGGLAALLGVVTLIVWMSR